MRDHPNLNEEHRKRARDEYNQITLSVCGQNVTVNIGTPPPASGSSPDRKKQRYDDAVRPASEADAPSKVDAPADEDEEAYAVAPPEADVFADTASRVRLPSGNTLFDLYQNRSTATKEFGPGLIIVNDYKSNAKDYEYLKNLTRYDQDVSPFFTRCLELWRPFVSSPANYALIPAQPAFSSDADYGEWTYISSAIPYLVRHLKRIAHQSLTHGEVWTDMNLWSRVLDGAFIESEHLSLDRREIQSFYIGAKHKFDGVVRPLTDPQARATLGLIEMNPARLHSVADPISKDRAKLIRALRTILLKTNKENSLVVGVLCTATQFQVIRGILIGGVCVFRLSNEYSVQPDTQLLDVLEYFWKMRLCLDAAYVERMKSRASIRDDD